MKKCKLSDLKKHCVISQCDQYYVEIKHFLRSTFTSIEVILLPDMICFEGNGNYLSIHLVTSIYKDGVNHFVVYSDYFGKELEIHIYTYHSFNKLDLCGLVD